MIIVFSRNQVPVRLTGERLHHIPSRHPEMESQRSRVLETVESSDCVQEGDFGELLAIRRYARTPLTSKFLVVAYREVRMDDGFIWRPISRSSHQAIGKRYGSGEDTGKTGAD